MAKSPEVPTLDEKRRGYLLNCGRKTAEIFADDPARPQFREGSDVLAKIVRAYKQVRSEFVARHGIKDSLLANHKVAAIWTLILTETKPEHLFEFAGETPSNARRAVLVAYMYTVIYGLLEIDPADITEQLHEDLEYCLLKEPPNSLEWLCLTMHALCHRHGTVTNTRR
ncbi:MAG: hypothetical protein H7841_00715 [Magnetospirillum sp. WYHS-4]